jgi:pimeloyl-ACP methyl ester carboxylesterase
VVFVPGLGLDAREWWKVRRELAGESAVILLPALGKPSPKGTDLGVTLQAERLLAELPLGRELVLVGHSASCPVVVDAAARSEDVVGLVLVGPVTDPRERTWPRMLRQWIRTALHERVWELPVLVPQYHHTGVLTMLRGIDAIRHFPTQKALAPLTLPVSVLRGEYDRIAPADWCRHLAEVSGGELASVVGAAHMLPLTHPHTVVSSIVRLGTGASRGA